MVCGAMVWCTVHMCASAHGGQSLLGSRPVFLAHSSVYPWGRVSHWTWIHWFWLYWRACEFQGCSYVCFSSSEFYGHLFTWFLEPNSGLSGVYSQQEAPLLLIEPTTCSVLTVRVPCSQPQIGPCGVCSSLWLLRSHWLWSRVFCGQSVVSLSHSLDKCCGFLFSLPLRHDVVSLSLFPLCKWEWSLTYTLRSFCLCTHLNRILLLLLPFGNSLLI